jgi:uncharacterized protein involved in exopolysaccharide biosynthesis
MAITKLKSSRDFFRIWFYWKPHAIKVFILIVGAIMFYAYTTTPVYKSTAKVLLLSKSNQNVVITAGEDERQIISAATTEDVNTEIELIQSDKVLEETVRSFEDEKLGLSEKKRIFDKITDFISDGIDFILVLINLKNKALTALEAQVSLLKNSLEIEAVFSSSMIFVTLEAQDPKRATTVLNRLLQIYIKHHNAVFSIDEGQKFYDDQAMNYKIRLENAEQELKAFKKNLSIVDIDKQNLANITLLADLTKELHLLEIVYDEAKSRIELLTNSMSRDNELLITREMRMIPAIYELEKGMVPIFIKRSEIRKNFTETSREYKEINSQIKMIENDIRNVVLRTIKTDELELASLGMKKQSLQDKIFQLEAIANKLQQNEQRLQELKRNVDLHKNNYILYASKTEDSRVYSEQRNRDLANVTIADHPHALSNPVWPNKMLLLSISICLGLLAALCTPFLLEALDHRLKTAEDVELLLSLPVISSFSEIK